MNKYNVEYIAEFKEIPKSKRSLYNILGYHTLFLIAISDNDTMHLVGCSKSGEDKAFMTLRGDALLCFFECYDIV